VITRISVEMRLPSFLSLIQDPWQGSGSRAMDLQYSQVPEDNETAL